jgi:putative addiction module killer protein
MLEVRTTEWFDEWFAGLTDRTTRMRIQVRIDRLTLGNFGARRELKGGIGELKIDFGPGYRIYYARRGGAVVILLCGGDKSRQARDIELARDLASRL